MHQIVTMRFALRSALALVTALVLLSSASTTAVQAGPSSRQSSLERAANAAQQLREYHQRLRGEAATTLKLRSLSQTPPPSVGIRINQAMATSSTIFFYDNFESPAHTWSTVLYGGATDDLWHLTTLDASSPTHSYWPGVENQANYATGRHISTALKSETINLTAALAPVRLLFTENYETEAGWDYCMVDASTDNGATWTHLRGGYGTAPNGSSGGWQISSLDLSSFVGHNIVLRFYFDTGDEKFNNFPGWFVDDIVIFDQGGTITGKKFFDVNNNSIKDPGERGVKDWVITANGPVTLTTKTNYRGRYWLPLPLGTYTVSEAFQPNWTQTYPLSGTWTVSLAKADTVADSVHFGNYIHASFINGMKFHDLNHNAAFDGGDTVLGEWKIVLEDTSGNMIDYDRTDSLGQYSLYVFQPGRYVVREVQRRAWVQSYPANETYTIDIPNLSTVSNGNDFGNYYSPATRSISGTSYDDRNRNALFDLAEAGVEGFQIKLTGVTIDNHSIGRSRITDSTGFFQFPNLPAGNYSIKILPRMGWWPSTATQIALTIDTTTSDSGNNFGSYAIAPGSIGGTVYNDANNDALPDNSEPGLPGWTVELSGATYFGTTSNESVPSDGSGHYSLAGIWPGQYTVSEIFHNNWRQTQPASLLPYHVTLGAEENLTGTDFGNIQDSTFSLAFRSFVQESLALGVDAKGKTKPILVRADKEEFGVFGSSPSQANGIKNVRVKFSVAVIPGTLRSKLGTISPVDLKNLVFDIAYNPAIAPGVFDTLTGFASKPKTQLIKNWIYTFDQPAAALKIVGTSWNLGPGQMGGFFNNTARFPMPNTINVIQLTGNGLRVGLGGAHSVVHVTYKDVLKSLIDSHGYHIGDPRCLAVYTNNALISRQQRYLTPTKENNKLFAELIAFKTNIIASDLGITSGGFGNLVFDDGTGGANILNGMSLREIAASADSIMSSVDYVTKTCDDGGPAKWVSPASLYKIVRMIDSAFSGPVDTVFFSSRLKLTDVRPLSAVGFLRLDPRAAFKNYKIEYPTMDVRPDEYRLSQNYPNPFNPTTEIEFYLPQQSVVTLKIYNVLGQEVATLIDRQTMSEGSQLTEFHAEALPSGVYFYRMSADGIADGDGAVMQKFTSIKKMMLVK
jgi:hypothetical protein